jgi:PAS domain S-box-containing protein
MTEFSTLSANNIKTALDQVLVCVVIFEPETLKFSYANRGAVDQLGYSSAELLEMTLLDICSGFNREMLEPLEQGEEASIRFETECRHKDGSTVPVGVFMQYVSADGGESSFIGIARNIADKKDQEIQLRHLQKMESIGQLAAGIAHEINTPTQYVADNTHFLKEAFDDLQTALESYDRLLEAARQGSVPANLIEEVDAAKEEADLEYIAEETPKALEQALEGLQKISIIVSAMKEFSHPGGDDKELVDINGLINNTLTVSRNEWKYVAKMETELDPTLPMIPGFKSKLSQVFLNLIVNAAHAIAGVGGEESGQEGVIRIVTSQTDDSVEVRISDNGPGVPEELKNRIFDPFFTTKEVGKGTGQGLSIAHSVVVDKHGGSLELEQENGTGAIFVIRLPMEEPEQP